MKNIIILSISLLLSYHFTNAMVVLEVPEVVAAQNTLVCTYANIELTATITNEGNITGSISYEWTGPNGFTSTEQNPNIGNASLANAGTYNVSVTSNEGQGTASVEVEVYDVLPAASIDGPEIVCEGESFTLCISDFKDYPGNPFTLSAENSTASQSS